MSTVYILFVSLGLTTGYYTKSEVNMPAVVYSSMETCIAEGEKVKTLLSPVASYVCRPVMFSKTGYNQ